MKRRLTNTAQNLIILLLVIAAVIQTGQLWLGAGSNRSFFYFFDSFSLASANTAAASYSFASPYRIAFGEGDAYIKIKYNGLDESEGKKLCDAVIAECIKSGEFIARSAIELSALLKNKYIIYEYAFEMPAALFTRCYAQRGTALLSQVTAFDSIVITQDENDYGAYRLYFINRAENAAYEFFLAAPDSYYSFDTVVSDVVREPYGIRFAFIGDEPYFTEAAYVPQIPDDGYGFHPVFTRNPYAPGSSASIYTVEREIDSFFINPIAKSSNIVSGIYTYSDSNTVVKYYTGGLLEYQNFKTGNRKTDQGLLNDYAAAIGFIGKDPYVVNEYYLAGYKESDGKREFYFDYCINDFKIIIPDALRSDRELGTKHAITVSVELENVVGYRKIAYAFTVDSELTEMANRGFDTLIKEVVEPYMLYTDDTEIIQDLEIGYKLEKSSSIYLNWFMRINDVNFVSPAQAW